MIWWEKTVEYNFIISAFRHKKMNFAVPLSGMQEISGDGVFGVGTKLVLVEFKRSKKTLSSEIDKFVCYDDAKNKLSGDDTFHFLVYGSDGGEFIKLHAAHYFTRREVLDPYSIFESGVEYDEFSDYLRRLIDLKKSDNRSDGSVGPEFLTSVMGVTATSASTISFTEYVRLALPDLYQGLSPTRTVSSTPSFGP